MTESSLGIRLLNSIYRFVISKQGELPLFHGNDIPEFIKASDSSDLNKCKPYKAGINTPALQNFITDLSKDKRVGLAGIGVMVDGKLVSEYYNAPYSNRYRHVSFSLCKSITSMAVGLCVSDGLLSLDEKLCDIFREHDGIFMKRGMKAVTIRNLLTMTAGVNFDEVSSYFNMDWCKAYMGSDLAFMPGEDFFYNSLNSYMLASIVHVKTGKTMLELLDERIFAPLGITDITWDKCPKGTEVGGWGMKLSIPDMLKLGELYRNHGKALLAGKWTTLIDAKWIKQSIECHVKLDDPLCVKGYGYHIWLLKDGSYLFNGVFGQNVYINEARKLVIAITASAYEIFPDGRLVDSICKFAAEDANFVSVKAKWIPKHPSVYKRKQAKLRKREVLEFLAPFFGVEYHFKEYASSILPLSAQVLYANYLSGIEGLTLDYGNEYINLLLNDNGISFNIKLGFTDENPFCHQIIEVGGKQIPLAACGELTSDEDGNKLFRIHLVYPEEIGNRIIKLYFNEDGIRLKAIETPNIFDIAELLIGEKKMLRAKKLDKINMPDYARYKAEKLISPSAFGIKTEDRTEI